MTMIITLFMVTGCASSDPRLANRAEEITGIFESASDATHARFDEDGSFRLGPSLMLVTNEPLILKPKARAEYLEKHGVDWRAEYVT